MMIPSLFSLGACAPSGTRQHLVDDGRNVRTATKKRHSATVPRGLLPVRIDGPDRAGRRPGRLRSTVDTEVGNTVLRDAHDAHLRAHASLILTAGGHHKLGIGHGRPPVHVRQMETQADGAGPGVGGAHAVDLRKTVRQPVAVVDLGAVVGVAADRIREDLRVGEENLEPPVVGQVHVAIVVETKARAGVAGVRARAADACGEVGVVGQVHRPIGIAVPGDCRDARPGDLLARGQKRADRQRLRGRDASPRAHTTLPIAKVSTAPTSRVIPALVSTTLASDALCLAIRDDHCAFCSVYSAHSRSLPLLTGRSDTMSDDARHRARVLSTW
jgi:hypothetical protein